jgi:hypothetical protein
MPTQNFKLYTANGYAGDLVDSGPRVIQTGVLVANDAGVSDVGFGLAMLRQVTGVAVDRGVELGGSASVFAISQREYNHEAGTRPAKAGVDGTWAYHLGESVSLIRQGFLYVKIVGSNAITAGAVLNVDTATGVFSKDTVAGNVVATTNVVAEEAGLAGDVIKVRIDIA